MRRILLLISITFFVTARPVAQTEGDNTLMGFTKDHATEQLTAESRFDGFLHRNDLRVWMKRLSARPHHIGSPYGKANAEFIASQFRTWGFDTNIEEFDVLFPTPKSRLLEMVFPTSYTAKLTEPALAEDSTSDQQGEQLPTYNAYSIDGDVTGELVYANYGVPKDYEDLGRLGIDVRGKIVITRYGGSWRGIKPKVAAEHGAIGCIIYSDPKDDGYYDGDVYPKGPYRNDNGVQRGSVADMPQYAGDPLTPFIGATKNAKRLSLKEATTLTKIPVLPISYGDAEPLLRAMGGPVAQEEWRGALPITYHVGPGPAKVHLKIAFNWDIVPAFDVIGKISGSANPDQWIIRGNHHDAWVNGADDPISGQVAMMEEARGIGELLASGWRPKRTLIYCAWDGEEPGLLGSTEWAEAHADALKQKAVVYINSDSNGRGFLNVGGSHALQKFVNQVARDVMDPEKHVSVGERARALRIVESQGNDIKEARNRLELPMYALGSGSDFTPFIQHLGISALNFGYGGEDGGGSYHSVYDSYSHYTRFMDTSFEYGITMAKTGGRMVLRLADADILQFDFNDFSETVSKYGNEVAKLVDDMRDQTEELNQKLRERSLSLAADPHEPFVEPKRQDAVPYINFAPVQNALATVGQSAKNFDRILNELHDESIVNSPKRLDELNDVLMKAERSLTLEEGLPGRPWYIHQIYAPGFYTGYSVKTLPAIREAIELRNWKQVEQQVEVVAKVLMNFSHVVDRATDLLTEINSSKH
jgi:N-acetylated-alpha-linked acidic dipeptidase